MRIEDVACIQAVRTHRNETLAEMTAVPKMLHWLASALRRNGDDRQVASPVAKALKPRSRPEQSVAQDRRASATFQRARDSGHLREIAKAQSQANAAELQSNPDVLSRLEEMISARLGAAVRHVRSEPVLKSRPVPARSIVHRRAYTRHWFEVSGALDERLRTRVGDDRQLVIFVKSASRLWIRPPVEMILSEQGGQGFRAPYFFGSFAVSDLQIAAWEFLEITPVHLRKYSFEDQERLVKAIAGVNALNAAGAAPVLTKWINVRRNWFDSRYLAMEAAAGEQWKELHAGTVRVLEHQDRLALQVRSAGETFLTHNDVTLGTPNVFVPADGDVVIFDWEGSTLSVPGADLGLLTQISSGDRLMSCYVEKMAEYGFKLDLNQIRFTAEVLGGFRYLQAGWRDSQIDHVEQGLRLLARHIDRKRPAARGASVKAPSAELNARQEEHLGRHGSRPYQPILHPAFSHLGYQNGPERFDLIAPHLEYRNGTVLDIGSQWGYMAHRLEDLGYRVTAVEASRVNQYFLTELRDLCGKEFEIIRDSVFNLADPKYDIVFALNIFHHFMKTEQAFEKFENFLDRLKCRMMIYQAHVPTEPQMEGAYRNMDPEQATEFLSEKLSLPRVIRIGTYRKGRQIFKLAE